MSPVRISPVIRNAAWLAAAFFACKLLGFAVRVPLVRLLGGEGMGLYQMAYSVYGLALTLAVGGIPTAVSILVAEGAGQESSQVRRRVLRQGLLIVGIAGLLVSAAMFLTAGPLGALMGDVRSVPAIRVMAPAVFLVALASALRGYFQGLERIAPVVVSELAEQVVRISAMLYFTVLALPRGLQYAVAGATFATVPAALAAIMVLRAAFQRLGALPGGEGRLVGARCGPGVDGRDHGLVRTLQVGLPVGMAALMTPVMETMNAMIIPRRLQVAGFGVREATAMYGYLMGVAGTVVAIPVMLATSLSYTLAPATARARASQDHARAGAEARRALTLILHWGIVNLVLLAGFSREIVTILFSTPEAGESLYLLAGTPVLMGLQEVSAAALRGLQRHLVPVQGLVAGILVSAVTTYSLTGHPELGLKGAAVGILAGWGVAMLWNLAALQRLVGAPLFPRGVVVKAFVSAVAMALASYETFRTIAVLQLGSVVGLGLAVAAGLAIYFLSQVVMGGMRVLR